METPLKSSKILRRLQGSSNPNRVQDVMNSIQKARSMIQVRDKPDNQRLSTASQLAQELELHNTPLSTQTRRNSMIGAFLVRARQQSCLSEAMNIWVVRACARRKWRHDVTDTTNLLQLQGVVLKDLASQLEELQGLLTHLKAGKAEALKALLPGVRDASWTALIEELEALVLVFESKVGALSEGHSITHKAISAELCGDALVVKHVDASIQTVALCRIVCGLEGTAQCVLRAVCAWRLAQSQSTAAAQALMLRRFNDWRLNGVLQREQARSTMQQATMAKERAEHAKQLAALQCQIAELQCSRANASEASSSSPSQSPSDTNRAQLLPKRLEQLRSRFQELELEPDKPAVPTTVSRSPMLKQELSASTPQSGRKKGALLRALKERYNH